MKTLLQDEPALEPLIFIVDGDAGPRQDLVELFRSQGCAAIAFGSAGEYLTSRKADRPSCLIVDVDLPDIHGVELQRQLARDYHPPIIFIAADCTVATSVRAIKAGAIDFLMKPCCPDDLMAAVEAALQQDRRIRAERREQERLRHRHACLTPREQQVLPLVVGGFLNKQAAAQLGISETTLQVHRSRIMRKMEADSLAQLVRMASKLALPLPLEATVDQWR